jgi:pentatricopeptide repeat protein
MLLVDDIIKWIVKTASLTKVDETRQAQLTTMRPNVILFSSAMNAWVKSGLSEAPVKVEELLEEMKLLNDEFPEWEDIQPNKVSYSTAIDAWAKTGNVDKVQGLLQEMHQLHHDTNDESIKPGLHAFNGYLVALVKQGRAEEAEAVLHQMEDFYESGELDEAPTVVSYSTVLDGFARSKMDGASYQAESLLRQMFVRQEENRGVKPNAISFNSVIHAHIQSGNIQAAEVLLHEMNDAYSSTGDTEIRPTLETYGNILSGLAKSRRKDAGERAENLLKYIKDMAVSGALEGPPDDVIYNAVLDCWAKSGNENSAQRARAVLDGMKEDGVSPDVISYNTVIQCMAKSRKLREAETLLNDMEKFGVQPNGITYNSLLSAYVASAPPGGKKQQQFSGRIAFLADCVEKLFERMKQDTNIPADVVTHNTVLNFYSKIGDVDRVTMLFNAMLSDDSAVRPDTTSVNTVINAWANSGRPDAAEQAENIFDELLLGEGSDLSPNPISFNSVMKAWTKSRAPEAAERCQRFFDVLKRDFAGELRPDFVTFNILIHAWSLSEDDNAPDFAERTFEEMKRRYEEGESRMRPNNMTFGALINVWSKSSRPEAGEKAGLYLRNIIQNSERGSNGEQPRVFEFTSAIRAWEKSGDVRAPFKADEILYLLLKEVKEGNKMAKPDSQFFGAFLSCLASSRVADKCLYANRVVQMMKDFRIRPNRFLLYQIKKCYAQDAHSKETKSSVESSQALQ